eukprot:m.105230 g.105230  ORF g.105230 m.105230 type:complete len:113 (-) comp12638_c0_seq2:2737-3075(-)
MNLELWLVGYFLIKVVGRLWLGPISWDHTSLLRKLRTALSTAAVESRSCTPLRQFRKSHRPTRVDIYVVDYSRDPCAENVRFLRSLEAPLERLWNLTCSLDPLERLRLAFDP